MDFSPFASATSGQFKNQRWRFCVPNTMDRCIIIAPLLLEVALTPGWLFNLLAEMCFIQSFSTSHSKRHGRASGSTIIAVDSRQSRTKHSDYFLRC